MTEGPCHLSGEECLNKQSDAQSCCHYVTNVTGDTLSWNHTNITLLNNWPTSKINNYGFSIALTCLHPIQYLKRFSEIYAVLMIQNYSINVTVSLHVLTTRWYHCRIGFPLIHVVIIDQNPPDPPVQLYPKLNDIAITLSTWRVLHGMTDRFGFSRTTNLGHATKKYYFPVVLLFYDDEVIGHGSPFQLAFLPPNWY